MEDFELQNIWKEYDRKLEESRILNMQSWALNMKCFETLQYQKATSKLKGLITFKIIAVILGIVWVLFLGLLIYHSLTYSKIFFVVSVSVIAVTTSAAIIVYLKHIVWIKEIDNSNTIIETQEKLAKLQSSTLHIVRILFLQTPFYTSWWFTPAMVTGGDKSFWLISFPVFILFCLATIWLYRNISIKNADKKWFKILFNTPEWTSVVKAMGFIKEIDDFKNEH